jgi:hypothetical protein
MQRCTGVILVHMSTTITLDDGLVEDVRRRAAEEGLTLSELIERVLRQALAAPAPQQTAAPFRLVTFKGNGLRPGVDLERMAKLVEEEDAGTLHKAGR